MKKYSSVSIGRRKPAKINVQYQGILGANGPKRIPHKACLRTGKRLLQLEKTAWILQGWGCFAFNLPIINNQCDLQNNLQKMIGFIITINYLVRCHQHWDHTIPLTPPARGVSVLHWKSRDTPAAPLAELAQICPHQRPLGSCGSTILILPKARNDSGLQWCRAPGAPALLAPGAGRVQEGSFPGFSCKPKVRSAGFWHRQAQRNRDRGRREQSRTGRPKAGADPRGLGETGLLLHLCRFSLQDSKSCIFEVGALKHSEV